MTKVFWREKIYIATLACLIRSGNDTKEILKTAKSILSRRLGLSHEEKSDKQNESVLSDYSSVNLHLIALKKVLLSLDSYDAIHRPGRALSIFLGNDLKDSLSRLRKPYFASRQSGKWLLDAALSLLSIKLFLNTFRDTPINFCTSQNGIVIEALKCGEMFFSALGEHSLQSSDMDRIVEDVILDLIQFEREGFSMGQRLALYATNNLLPIRMRAYAAWGQPDVTLFNRDLAVALFRHTARRAYVSENRNLAEGALLALLDLAVSRAITRGDNFSILDAVEALWSEVIAMWPDGNIDQWASAASLLCGAARGTPGVLTTLLNSKEFGKSCLVHILLAQQATRALQDENA